MSQQRELPVHDSMAHWRSGWSALWLERRLVESMAGRGAQLGSAWKRSYFQTTEAQSLMV